MSENTAQISIAILTVVFAIGMMVSPVAAAEDDLVSGGDDELLTVGSDDAQGASAGAEGGAGPSGGDGDGHLEAHDGAGSGVSGNGSVEGNASGTLNASAGGSFANNGSVYAIVVTCTLPPSRPSAPCNVTTQQPESDDNESDDGNLTDMLPPGDDNESDDGGTPGLTVDDVHADLSQDAVGAGANVSGTDGGSNNATVGVDCETNPQAGPSQDDCAVYTPDGGDDDGGDEGGMPSLSIDDIGVAITGDGIHAHGAVTFDDGSNASTHSLDCTLSSDEQGCDERPGPGQGDDEDGDEDDGGNDDPSPPTQPPGEVPGPIADAISTIAEALGRG